MLRRWLDTYKPRATSSTQVLLAELMWTVVGSGLSIVGLFWVLRRYGNAGLVYVAPFLILGFIKAVFILDLSLIHISEPTRRTPISYAVFCLKKKNTNQ